MQHGMMDKTAGSLPTAQHIGANGMGHVGFERSAQSDVGSGPASPPTVDMEGEQLLEARVKSSDLTISFLRVSAYLGCKTVPLSTMAGALEVPC